MEFLKNLLSEKTYTDLVAKLGEDLVKQINEKSKDFKIDVAEEKFIPKAKFDEANSLVKDYKEQVAQRDLQITQLGEKAKGSEELTAQINALKEANEKAKADYDSKILAREKDYYIDGQLVNAGAKNVKAVKAILDLESLEYKDGKISGLDELIKSTKEKEAYLFSVDKSKDEAGGKPGTGKKASTIEGQFEQFRKMK
jgi:hypothetical protein